jgi:hypothetical protein
VLTALYDELSKRQVHRGAAHHHTTAQRKKKTTMIRMSLQPMLTALVLLATLHTLLPLSHCSDPPIDLAVDAASLILTGGEYVPFLFSFNLAGWPTRESC